MKRLTGKESQIMKCLWDATEKITSSEITRLVNLRYGEDWKLTTVSTYLARICNKGFIELERNGKVYTYNILISEEEYLQQEMAHMVNFWSGGNSFKLLTALYSGRKITESEKQEIVSLLDDLDK